MIAQLRAGDPAAWAQWVRRMGPAIERYAARSGHPDPPEVAGAVLESLVARVGKFEGDLDDLRTFAFSVAHARIVDAHRRRTRRRETTTAEVESLVTTPRAAHSGTVADLVEMMLVHLSPVERAVMTALHLEGLSIAETARQTGRSEGAVRAASFRARGRLRRLAAAAADQGSPGAIRSTA